MLSLADRSSLPIFLDISWPADDVAGFYFIFSLRPKILPSSAVAMSKPVSMKASTSAGEAGLWPKMKALKVSDQKYEAAIIIDSFFSISAMESLMHWSNLRSPQYVPFVLLTLRNQSFHPLVGFGQDQKVSFHRSREKFSALKGILLVSVLIRSVGSGSPIGPRHWRWGCSVGIMIFLLKS